MEAEGQHEEGEPEFIDEGVIRCICGTIEDDGFTIQCERCYVWQHAVCVDITQDTVPEIYYCESCNPRSLDYEKATAIQIKRIKEEKKKARLEKQSPRKRKESFEFQSNEFGGRKRIKDQPFQDDLLSPRKRFKDGIFDSPGRGGLDYGHHGHEDWSAESPRFFLPEQQLYSFTHLPIREPVIKKKEFPLQDQEKGEDQSAAVKISSHYDSEYSSFLMDFSTISSSYKVTQEVHDSLSAWFDLSKSFPLAEVLDPFVDNEQDDWVFQPCSAVALLSSSKPWTMNAYYAPLEANSKKFASFASVDLAAGSFIAKIKGSLCSSNDLDVAEKHLSMNPVFNAGLTPIVKIKSEDGTKTTEPHILPPFVFPFPIQDEKPGAPSYFVDAREFGDFDGRFTRFSCGSPDSLHPNAEIRVIAVIDEPEIGDRPMYGRTTIDTAEAQTDPPLFPIVLSDRFKLGIFASRKIFKGDEIILANTGNFYGFPCSCTKKETCIVSTTIAKVQEYTESVNGDLMDTDNEFFDKMREREHERQTTRTQTAEVQQTQLVPSLVWNYSVKNIISAIVDQEMEGDSSDDDRVPDAMDPATEIESKDNADVVMEDANNAESGAPDKSTKEEPDVKVEAAEPEKPVEPKRVNFMDFMKQLSTTSAISLTPKVEPESAPSAELPAPEKVETAVTAAIDPEKDETITPQAKSIEPAQKSPVLKRISLDSSSIKAFAINLTKEVSATPVPVVTAAPPSIDTTPSVAKAETESAKSPPFRSPLLSAPLKIESSIPERPDSRRSDGGSAISASSPAMGIQRSASTESLDKVNRRDDRVYRERRESEPMYPLYRGDTRGEPRDTMAERGRNVRESFPPPRSNPPGRMYNRDPPPYHRDFRPDHPRDIPPPGRDYMPPPTREYRPDGGRDLPPRDFRPENGREMLPPREFRPEVGRDLPPRDFRPDAGRDMPPSRDFRPDNARDRPMPPARDFRPDHSRDGRDIPSPRDYRSDQPPPPRDFWPPDGRNWYPPPQRGRGRGIGYSDRGGFGREAYHPPPPDHNRPYPPPSGPGGRGGYYNPRGRPR